MGTGAQVYSTAQQAKSAEAAAEFNAEQARNAAKVSSDDARQNALRRQEEHRKYLAGVRSQMLETSNSIEGGDADFLDEAEGNLQLRILDASASQNRQQAEYANAAFRYDHQADTAKKSGPINTAGAVASGFNSIYSTGKSLKYWGQPKANPAATKSPSTY
tara:strand:- start:2762 stop:3244 length:483 start_codon:yes stop_codon:yes gene_type:complete